MARTISALPPRHRHRRITTIESTAATASRCGPRSALRSELQVSSFETQPCHRNPKQALWPEYPHRPARPSLETGGPLGRRPGRSPAKGERPRGPALSAQGPGAEHPGARAQAPAQGRKPLETNKKRPRGQGPFGPRSRSGASWCKGASARARGSPRGFRP